MSGIIASRYIGGVPYGPGMGVSRYAPNAGNFTSGSPVALPPVTTPATLPNGGEFAPIIQAMPGFSGLGSGSGGNALTAAAGGGGFDPTALLPLLGMIPDAYNAVSGWLSPSGERLPTPPEFLSPEQAADLPRRSETDWAPDATGIGPYGVPIVQFGGDQFGYVPPGASPWSTGDGILWDPTGAASRLGSGGNGAVYPGDATGGATAQAAVPTSDSGLFGGATSFFNPLGIPANTVQYAGEPLLGTFQNVPIEALGTSAIASRIFSEAGQNLAKPGGELGASIGSTLGGVAGMFTGPLAPIAVPLLTLAGGAIGGQIGPAPTIGANFSSIGTIGGDGQIHWSGMGGDNGATGQEATDFANWFTPTLMQQAAAQGYGLNPNMAGAQFRIGGYDNFSRAGETPGGFFYTPDTLGGSPENYALRPSDQFAAYSPEQANAFTTNVLADLAARNVFTQGGAATGSLTDYNASHGAPLGWYGGGDFGDALAQRQSDIMGFTNQQNYNNLAQQALGASYTPGSNYGSEYAPGVPWQAVIDTVSQGQVFNPLEYGGYDFSAGAGDPFYRNPASVGPNGIISQQPQASGWEWDPATWYEGATIPVAPSWDGTGG